MKPRRKDEAVPKVARRRGRRETARAPMHRQMGWQGIRGLRFSHRRVAHYWSNPSITSSSNSTRKWMWEPNLTGVSTHLVGAFALHHSVLMNLDASRFWANNAKTSSRS